MVTNPEISMKIKQLQQKLKRIPKFSDRRAEILSQIIYLKGKLKRMKYYGRKKSHY